MNLTHDLVKRYEGLKADRTTVEDQWEAIERYVTPYRGRFFTDTTGEHTVEWDRRYVYDSTAISAHQMLAASIHGALTSPAVRWFDLRFRNAKLKKSKAATQWLQEVSERMFFELQDSNFNLEINEVYQDLAGFGTAGLVLEEGDSEVGQWGGLSFKSIPLKELYFETDARGEVLRFYREIMWTPAQIVAKFGEDTPQTILDKQEAGDTSRQRCLYVVFPNGNKLTDLGKKVSAAKRPFSYQYILLSSREVMGEGGYYEMPSFVPRWRKTSESEWGNSPAMVAMGDILTLNHARKLQLVASEKMIDPPLFAEERALLGDLDISSGALSVVRDLNGIKAFGTGGNIQVSDVLIQQLQEAVKEMFFTTQLQFPPTQGTPMSATEAQIRYEQLQKLLGPTLGRLRNDLLDPTVERCFRMLARKGQLPEAPPIVMELDPSFDVHYTGSLARAQSVDNAASVERWVSTAANLAGVLPDILDVIDPGEVARSIGRDLNVPAECYRDAAQVAQIQQQRQAAQQKMMEAQQVQAVGEANKATAEADAAMGGGE